MSLKINKLTNSQKEIIKLKVEHSVLCNKLYALSKSDSKRVELVYRLKIIEKQLHKLEQIIADEWLMTHGKING